MTDLNSVSRGGQSRCAAARITAKDGGSYDRTVAVSALSVKLRQPGFTLIEIMVVVVILGILAALVAPNVMRRIDDAQITKVKQDVRAFETALSLYKMDNYKYPSTDQGLKALTTQPNDPTVRNWKPGGYLGSGGLTKDPWQNEYLYVYPGQHGEYDIYSLGADAQEGGEGVNADRGNWQTE